MMRRVERKGRALALTDGAVAEEKRGVVTKGNFCRSICDAGLRLLLGSIPGVRAWRTVFVWIEGQPGKVLASAAAAVGEGVGVGVGGGEQDVGPKPVVWLGPEHRCEQLRLRRIRVVSTTGM